MMFLGKFRANSIQMIALGFAGIILIGTLLLSLPAASRDGASLPFIDALFTSASATCVTGLVVHDTYTQFSLFGQIVILCLIQIGGLGFMTVATLFLMMARRKIGLAERGVLTESVSAFQIGGIVRLIRRIIICTAIVEGMGAILLAIRFCPQMGVATGVYYAVFHSISAFCNAGFDLMGRFAPYTSLIPYQSDVLVNLTIMTLIVIGGLGFVVWDDIMEHKLRYVRYKLHTKIVLLSTAFLIIGGAILFYAMEQGNVLAAMHPIDKLLASLFQSITPRTAGFNTVDTAALTEGGTVLSMLLMLIGASPGSTGGGIKTTTIMVILLATISYIRNTDDINIFHRRLENNTIKRAYCSTTIYIMLSILGIFLLITTQGLPVKDAAFETLSALGTVGLSTGITRELDTLSRMVIILLMYSGRVGSLTLLMAVMMGTKSKLRNPEEKIIIG
ncbi:potassium uptake protein, TrkH family [Desulfitobacterium hafniense DCB-2]|uniref:Potassium uptake protein, TrkH family n=1 Tax=Desulfitobacterium hafniense (strain DSM 10664 / DCB-2) TaxID=272564 RepID=B8FPA9_DESHD|nr:TrkH family potassium uptake protein [Desulfitobacterium hafniense]ACL19634.1 potassium uptake protein, TrkH family [Desulfitobacterium hafniense DCB-2]